MHNWYLHLLLQFVLITLKIIVFLFILTVNCTVYNQMKSSFLYGYSFMCVNVIIAKQNLFLSFRESIMITLANNTSHNHTGQLTMQLKWHELDKLSNQLRGPTGGWPPLRSRFGDTYNWRYVGTRRGVNSSMKTGALRGRSGRNTTTLKRRLVGCRGCWWKPKELTGRKRMKGTKLTWIIRCMKSRWRGKMSP